MEMHGNGIIPWRWNHIKRWLYCTMGRESMKTKPYYRNWIIPYHESNFPYKIQMWIKIHSITPKSPQTSHSWTALIVCQENRNQEICRDMKRSVHISLSPFWGGNMAQQSFILDYENDYHDVCWWERPQWLLLTRVITLVKMINIGKDSMG